MAGSASHSRFVKIQRVAGQGKARQAMIKSPILKFGRSPIEGSVAGSAVSAQQPQMSGGLAVAGDAGCIGGAEVIIGMALVADQHAMFAGQRKDRF